MIAPRAVLIDATNNDYADNAEGDAIGYEGAKAVYEFLGVPQNRALDLDMGNTGHGLTPAQAQHIVDYANFVLSGTPLSADVETQLTTDPYLNAGIYDTYYGGLSTMMPWASDALHANLLTSLSVSPGRLEPAFKSFRTSYDVTVEPSVTGIQISAAAEDPKASISISGQHIPNGGTSPLINLKNGSNEIDVVVTSAGGVAKAYNLKVVREDHYEQDR